MKRFVFLKQEKEAPRWYILINSRRLEGKTEGLNLAGRVLDYEDTVLNKIPDGTEECYFQTAQWMVSEYDTQEELILAHIEDIL